VKHLIAELVARLLSAGAAVGAMTAAGGVVVVALAYALFALLRDQITPAGASAVVAAAFAVLILIGALVMAAKAKGGKRRKPDGHRGPAPEVQAGSAHFVGRIAEVARQRPIVAAGAAVAAGLLAWKNPRLVSAVMRAFEPRDDWRD
jgi:hypothetical protein